MDRIGDEIPGALDSLGIAPKPIPTTHRGIRYRSRLEAKWAVFLHALSIKAEYEPEGFALASGHYLPDFRLPKLGAWLEIKPPTQPSDTEKRLCHELAAATASSVYLACGLPQESSGVYAFRVSPDGSVWWDDPYALCECPRCGALGFEFNGFADRVCGSRCYATSDGAVMGFSERIQAAIRDAQVARFWDPID